MKAKNIGLGAPGSATGPPRLLFCGTGDNAIQHLEIMFLTGEAAAHDLPRILRESGP